MKIAEVYEHLLALISSESFLKMQGLNNEVPFFICPYPVKDDDEFNRNIKLLSRNLQLNGVKVLTINLYELCIDILTERNVLKRILTKEPEITKQKLMELLTNVLDVEKYLAPKITEKLGDAPYDVLFLTGVGNVYPYIRTHNILNNLHSKIKDHPAVIFFPGGYDDSVTGGYTLSLFSILKSDKYYRAFNILNRKL